MAGVILSTCRACGKPKTPGERCKPCASLRTARYRARHPEKQREVNRRQYLRQAEKRRQKSIAWNAANPDKVRERNRAYYEANAEKMRAKTRAWTKQNKSAVNAHTSNRKAAKLRATPQWADAAAMRAMYEQAAAIGLHVDHIVPLRSPFVCGLHCEANMQLLTCAENVRKGNRCWPDMWERPCQTP